MPFFVLIPLYILESALPLSKSYWNYNYSHSSFFSLLFGPLHTVLMKIFLAAISQPSLHDKEMFCIWISIAQCGLRRWITINCFILLFPQSRWLFCVFIWPMAKYIKRSSKRDSIIPQKTLGQWFAFSIPSSSRALSVAETIVFVYCFYWTILKLHNATLVWQTCSSVVIMWFCTK